MAVVWVKNPSKGPHGAFVHISASKISALLNGLDHSEGHIIAIIIDILLYDATRSR